MLLSQNSRPHALVILDGFGLSNNPHYNAVQQAKTPLLDTLKLSYFYTELDASGEHVGLPEGYVGNSEVGHLTIGCGRIIPQSLTALNTITLPDHLVNNPTFIFLLHDYYKKNHPRIHLIGMISDEGIHSHIQHMKNILETIQLLNNDAEVVLHYILDGRDALPRSALSYILHIEQSINPLKVSVGSVHGRFYAMDRDNNQNRTEKSGTLFTKKTPPYPGSIKDYLEEQYKTHSTDEFIEPCSFIENHTIDPQDIVIFTNYRLDRIVQLAAYIDQQVKPYHVITPVPYPSIPSTSLYSPQNITNGLIATLSKNNKTIFSIAETEKHAHISYFFNGGTAQTYNNEQRVFIPSHKEQSFADNPEMSAREITQAVLDSLEQDPCDFYLINYANADMVGHSGDLQATIKAVECLDRQISILYEKIVKQQQGTLFITADHGNAEEMLHEQENEPNSSHTKNKVPFFAINAQNDVKKMQGLKDIAPCILQEMNIQIPEEMIT